MLQHNKCRYLKLLGTAARMEQCASFQLLQHTGQTGVNQSNRAINSLPFATNFSSNADLALKSVFESRFFPIFQGTSQKSCFGPLPVLWLSGLQVGARPKKAEV